MYTIVQNASAKIPEREWSTLPTNSYGQLLDYYLHVLALST